MEGQGQVIGQWILIGIVVAFIAFEKAKTLYQSKNGKDKKNGTGTGRYKYNPHPPGSAPECIEHGKVLVKVQTDIENIKEDIKEIKGKI